METSLDAVQRGALLIEQPRRGYRFNLDALLLADFAAKMSPAPARLVDLGAGVGVVGLLLARRWPVCRVLLVELQPELARLAEANVCRNQLKDRVEVRCLDLREPGRWSDFRPELAVSNPPFFKVGSGRPSLDPQLSLARHEQACSLPELCASAAAGLPAQGRLALIHTADRELELRRELTAHGLHPQLLRRIEPLPARAPNRVLVMAGREVLAATLLDPLLVEAEPGRFSDEVNELLG